MAILTDLEIVDMAPILHEQHLYEDELQKMTETTATRLFKSHMSYKRLIHFLWKLKQWQTTRKAVSQTHITTQTGPQTVPDIRIILASEKPFFNSLMAVKFLTNTQRWQMSHRIAQYFYKNLLKFTLEVRQEMALKIVMLFPRESLVSLSN